MVFYDYVVVYLIGYVLSIFIFRGLNYYLNDLIELRTALGLALLSWLCVLLQVTYLIFTIYKGSVDTYSDWFISSKGYK